MNNSRILTDLSHECPATVSPRVICGRRYLVRATASASSGDVLRLQRHGICKLATLQRGAVGVDETQGAGIGTRQCGELQFCEQTCAVAIGPGCGIDDHADRLR